MGLSRDGCVGDRSCRDDARASRMRARVGTRIAAGVLLLILLLTPASEAQLPVPVEEEGIHVAMLCEDAFLQPDYTQVDVVSCLLQDFSRDSVAAGAGAKPTGPSMHPISITTRPAPGFANVTGWQILVSETNFAMRGGESKRIEVRAIATPAINSEEYDFEVVTEYSVQTGYNNTTIVPMVAQVNPYGLVLTSWVSSSAQKAGQNQVVRYELAVTNSGVYPDMYQFDVTADDALRITTPPNLFVPPGETRSVNISLLTPKDKLYELGLSAPIVVKVTSLGFGDIPGTGSYSAAATLRVRGAYVPIYWIPLTLVGLFSMGIVIRAGTDRGSRSTNERGAPRPVTVSPKQAVLLEALKRSDREKYREKRAALEVVYKERVSDYRAHRKERLAADREEAREARLEFVQQKKARKARQAEEKRARIEKRRADEVEAREVKKREKQLAKARKKLEKAQKKQAKIDAKLAAKQAKIDAKAAKAAAKQAARDAKAARAAAKAAAKAEKKKPK